MVTTRPAITTTSYPRCTWCDSPLEKGVCLYCEATEAKSSPIDTALASILSILQDDLHGCLDSKEMGIPTMVAGIRAILEALVEDAERNAGLTRSVRP